MSRQTKRALLILGLVLLLLGVVCGVWAADYYHADPEASALLTGDVNGDGEVGIGDIVAVTNVMAGLVGDGLPVAVNADVNGDGEVGIGDIVAITNIMAGAI
jgi:hypothetical protein